MAAERWAGSAFAVLVAAAALRLPVLEDEAYYWTWSRQLSFHYFDHPPLIAWCIRCAQILLREPLLAVRGVGLASMSVVFWAVPATAGLLAPGGDARRLARWALSGSLLFSVALWPATPDAPFAALLALAGYATARSMAGDNRRSAAWWAMGGGGLVAIATLAKLPALLVAAGSAPFLRGRTALGWAVGWTAAALVVVAWAGWAPGGLDAWSYQAERVSGQPARWPMALPLTLGGALLVVGLGPMVGLVRGPSSMAARPGWAAAVAVFTACAVAVGLGSGELNWLMPVLVLGVPPAVAAVVGTPTAALFLRAAQVQTALAAAVLMHVVEPMWPISPAEDRTLRSAGWAAVATEAERMMRAHGARAIVTDRYQDASLVRWYVAGPVLELGRGRPSQYDRWSKPRLCPGDRAVAIGRAMTAPGFVAAGRSATVARQRASRTVATVTLTPVETRSERWCGPEDEP